MRLKDGSTGSVLLTLRPQSEGSVGEKLPSHSKTGGEKSKARPRISWGKFYTEYFCILQNNNSQWKQLRRDLLQRSDSLCNGMCLFIVRVVRLVRQTSSPLWSSSCIACQHANSVSSIRSSPSPGTLLLTCESFGLELASLV